MILRVVDAKRGKRSKCPHWSFRYGINWTRLWTEILLMYSTQQRRRVRFQTIVADILSSSCPTCQAQAQLMWYVEYYVHQRYFMRHLLNCCKHCRIPDIYPKNHRNILSCSMMDSQVGLDTYYVLYCTHLPLKLLIPSWKITDHKHFHLT